MEGNKIKIIVATDSFKGSLTAAQACAAMAEGAILAAPEAEVECVPMADGGEGTVQSLVDGLGGCFVSCEVEDPVGRARTAVYGLIDNGTAVIEMAQASGLTLLAENERDPSRTSTFGTGQLIKDALDRGASNFIIGIGGSATNDAGAGMAEALGYSFFDKNGKELPRGGRALSELAFIDASRADERLKESRFTIACDVDNPLLGARGASQVFGPQKGATPEMAGILDDALACFADCVFSDLGKDIKDIPGSGAAGGLGAGCLAFLGAELKKGVDIVIGATGLKEKLIGCTLVITGEGRTDSQTLGGKTVYGVTKLVQSLGAPVIVISGSLSEGAEELLDHGVTRLYSIIEDGIGLEEAISNAAELLKIKTYKAIEDFINMR